MAQKLENQIGIEPDANYLKGKILDDQTEIGAGINQDIVQFFQKLMSLASLTANETDDNEANGYQFVDALISLIGQGTAKIYSLGVWNMGSTTSYAQDHGLTAGEIAKIVGVTVTIFSDSGGTHDYIVPLNGTAQIEAWFRIDPTSILLNVRAGGYYTLGTYNTLPNRGYVKINFDI